MRKVGEECEGFVAVDDQIKTLEEIQWARILVKTRGDFRPSVLEIEVEEDVYFLSLWWEFRPVVRKKHMICSEASGQKSDEISGDVVSHSGQLVEEELVSARLETLNLSAKVRGVQESGSGWEMVNRAQGPTIRGWASTNALVSGSTSLGLIVGPKEARRAGGLVLLNGSLGLKLKEVATGDDRSEAGPSSRRWAVEMDFQKLIGLEGMERADLVTLITQASSKGSQEKACLLNCSISRRVNLSETEPFIAWETEDIRKQQTNVSYSAIDRALEEEALRYGSVFYSKGKRALRASHLNSFYFDWAPEVEFYNRSGGIEEEFRVENTTWLTVDEGSNENDNGCWDLGEANRIGDKARGTEGDSGTSKTQAVRNENEEKWEESSLAKFNHFLGFPTEGLEKEILSFLFKIRKRREKIHSKELLEK